MFISVPHPVASIHQENLSRPTAESAAESTALLNHIMPPPSVKWASSRQAWHFLSEASPVDALYPSKRGYSPSTTLRHHLPFACKSGLHTMVLGGTTFLPHARALLHALVHGGLKCCHGRSLPSKRRYSLPRRRGSPRHPPPGLPGYLRQILPKWPWTPSSPGHPQKSSEILHKIGKMALDLQFPRASSETSEILRKSLEILRKSLEILRKSIEILRKSGNP